MANVRRMERLRRLRMQKGWSQRDLAEKLGVSRPCVGQWERGVREPSIQNLRQLADLFEVPVDYLIGHESPKQAPVWDLEDLIQQPLRLGGRVIPPSARRVLPYVVQGLMHAQAQK